MERAQIERQLREFIDTALMQGQGADLEVSTPLFEFGILDSFGLFRVIGYIGEAFGVDLPLDALRTEDFATIGTIATLVHARITATMQGA